MNIQQLFNGHHLPFVHVELLHNQTCIVRVDLSNQPELSGNTDQANLALRSILKKVYALEKSIWPHRISIRSLVLSTRTVSARAIMDLPKNSSLNRLRNEVHVLDFSKTLCSASALQNLAKFPNLEEVCFDNCLSINAGSVEPHPKVKVVSLLHSDVSPSCMKQFLTTFPHIEKLNVTLQMRTQLPLGFKDAYAFARPRLSLPCGHLTSAQKPDACIVQRNFIILPSLDVQITRLQNGNKDWNIHLLDVFKRVIEAGQPLYIHEPCEKLYGKAVPDNGICTECTTPVDLATLHPIHQDLDTHFDIATAFDDLPVRPAPNSPWAIVERGLENQAYMKANSNFRANSNHK